jgi:hypothetical protein
MSKFATPERFGLYEGNICGTWWCPPLGPQHRPIYQEYAAFIAAQYPSLTRTPGSPAAGARILIVGCGYGFTVDELRILGFNAWGCDGAQWAIDRGKILNPASAPFLVVADATSASEMSSVRSAMGLRNNQRIPLVVTEDLLSCADDASNAQAMALGINGVGTSFCHFITCYEMDDGTMGIPVNDGYYRTRPQWSAALPSGHLVVNINGGLNIAAGG